MYKRRFTKRETHSQRRDTVITKQDVRELGGTLETKNYQTQLVTG